MNPLSLIDNHPFKLLHVLLLFISPSHSLSLLSYFSFFLFPSNSFSYSSLLSYFRSTILHLHDRAGQCNYLTQCYFFFSSPFSEQPTLSEPQYTTPPCYAMHPPSLKPGTTQCTHIHMYTYRHTDTHTCIPTHIHTHADTITHVHTHTHKVTHVYFYEHTLNMGT